MTEFFLLFSGSYFCYDNPAALQDDMTRDLRLKESEFMSFYMWYSWPNVILCFFGGFLIDRVFGVRLGAIIFSCFVTVGQVCTSDHFTDMKFGILDFFLLFTYAKFTFYLSVYPIG